MIRMAIGLSISFALTAAATRVDAQLTGMEQETTPRMVRVGFGGGVSVPVSDAKDALKNGINGQGYLPFRLPGGLPAFRVNVSYQKFDFKEAVLLPGQTGDRPYITAGLGAFNVRNAIETASTTSKVSDTKFGIDGGAGFALKLGRIDGFIEARIQNVYTDEGIIDTKGVQFVPVTFGLVF
ncbi:MAG: hypothetical protein ABR543_10405 [Gemmatimonadaceae bacterium]